MVDHHDSERLLVPAGLVPHPADGSVDFDDVSATMKDDFDVGFEPSTAATRLEKNATWPKSSVGNFLS